MMPSFSGLLYFESMVEYKIWLSNHTKAMKTDGKVMGIHDSVWLLTSLLKGPRNQTNIVLEL